MAALPSCSPEGPPPETAVGPFFILQDPTLAEGTWVLAETNLISTEPRTGQLRIGARSGVAVWLDGAQLLDERRSASTAGATTLDATRIPITLMPGTTRLALSFANGPPPGDRPLAQDPGCVLRLTGANGESLRGVGLDSPDPDPGTFRFSALARGASPPAKSAGRTVQLDPVPVVFTPEEVGAYPLKATVERREGQAWVTVDWSSAVPLWQPIGTQESPAQRYTVERTARLRHRGGSGWQLCAETGSTSWTDTLTLSPEAWPFHQGDAMGRVVTYRITPTGAGPLDWTAPRLASALVLAPGFHDLAGVHAKLLATAQRHPHLVRIDTLGFAASHPTPILAARLAGPATPEDAPGILVVGHIHTREPFGIEVALDLLKFATGRYGADPQLTDLLDQAVLWVVPTMNPGGWAHLSAGWPGYMRKNASDQNGDGVFTAAPLYPIEWSAEPLLQNATAYFEGVDLNRNFAPDWELEVGDQSGQAAPGANRYRGPAPFSEPESRAMRDWVRRVRPRASLFYHEPGNHFYHLADTDRASEWEALAAQAGTPKRKRRGAWSGCSLAFMYAEGALDLTVEGATEARGDAEWLLGPRASARDSVAQHHIGVILRVTRAALAP